MLCVGSFELDRESYVLRWPSGEQRLTRKEGDVLKLLMQREGRTTERDLIRRLVWGESGSSSGEAWTSTLPGSANSKADPSVRLDTLHGVGFRLEGPLALESVAEVAEVGQQVEDVGHPDEPIARRVLWAIVGWIELADRLRRRRRNRVDGFGLRAPQADALTA